MDLVILAAGSGSRYGGLKQFESVGPNGECLFEYSVYHALQAGFDRIIFVIKNDNHADLITTQLASVAAHIEIGFAVQDVSASLDDQSGKLESRREKPWGSTHALLAAQSHIHDAFAVINADDYYGASAFQLISDYICTHKDDTQMGALVGYPLNATLSKHGGVNRGICQLDRSGWLNSIEETRDIRFDDTAQEIVTTQNGENITISRDTIVSMNFWCFHRQLLDVLKTDFNRFFKSEMANPNAELHLATSVNRLIADKRLNVKVLPTSESWCGLTYRDDLPSVKHFLKLHAPPIHDL